MRPGIDVRPVVPTDVDGVVQLCLDARAESSHGPQLCSADRRTVAQQIGALTAAPGGTLLVAVSEGRVVGLLLAQVMGPNLFTDEVNVSVEGVYVDRGYRRRGVGHALMLALTDVAAAAGAGHVYAAPLPGARAMQRFFVQLGFTPVAAHRVAATAALHRRLTQDGVAPRRSVPRGLEDLIARRRQSRGAAPLVVPAPVTPKEQPGVVGQPGRRGMSKQVRRAVQIRFDEESSTTMV